MSRRCWCLAVLVVLAMPAPAAAAGPLSAAAAVADGSRLQVVLTSSKALTSRTRPRSVTARVGGRALALRRTAARGRSSTWRSAALSGARAAALAALAGKAVPLTVVTRRGRHRLAPVLPAAAAPVGPGVPAPAAPAPTVVPAAPPATAAPKVPPGLTLTRDDEAGRRAVAAAGDLKLERYLSGGADTEIARAFFYANGVFRFFKVNWNMIMGERCDGASALEGSWTFKEGWTFPEQGGGIVVKLGVLTGGTPSEEVIIALNNDPGKVIVGSANAIFDVNPNMRDSC